MAPPIPGLPRPPVPRRRSAADVLFGILAVLALIVLAAGVPIALYTVFGLPIPHSRPTLSLLTHQLNILTIMKILSVIVWLAWIQLLFCLAAEISAAVRGHAVASQVPLAGGTQAMAHRLVAAALLLFSATVALSPVLHVGASGPAVPPRQAPVTASARPGGQQADGQVRTAQSADVARVPRHAQQKYYIVRPPVGRYHESLWEIAENHLGNGRRYVEIYELNKDRVQPDGTKLTIASLIRPGWVLQMPADAYGPGIHIASTADEPAQVASYLDRGAVHLPELHHEAVHRSAEEDRDLAPRQAPRAVVPAQAQRHDGHRDVNVARPTMAATDGVPFMRELAAASLLAAGLLVALGRRRREQLWRRGFGSRMTAPEGAAGQAEVAIRLGASEAGAKLLETNLRQLVADLAAAGRTPPTVFLAHLSDERLSLWVAPPDANPPSPWAAAQDGEVWYLPVTGRALDRGQSGPTLAPFPGLVSVGTDATGRVLVDLEASYGLIAISGPRPRVQEALAAMAVELATNRWSDRMELVLVGFGDELRLLAPDRVTARATLAEALPLLEERAARVGGALAATGLDSVLTGRARGIEPAAFAPCYLISAMPPDDDERGRLLALARTRHQNAAGYVIAGDVPGASWTWQISGDGRLRADLLGIDVTAQLLPVAQYAAVVELFRSALAQPAVPLEPPDPEAAPPAVLHPGPAAVEIQILGQALVQAPGSIEPERVALASEIVIYLATHPAGVHLNVLTGAIWPRGVTPEVRDAALGRVTDWLGADTFGRPLLKHADDGRLRLSKQVRVDWDAFRALVAQAPGPDRDAADYLATALELVHGQFLEGRGLGRYTWLATDDLEYEVTAQVADVAHRLCQLRLAAGDPSAAMEACRAGLRLAFNDELLWRDLLIAAHATGNELLLRSVVDEVSARAALDDLMPKLAPETEALIDEILPAWRNSVA
jgi:hypothetical protein